MLFISSCSLPLFNDPFIDFNWVISYQFLFPHWQIESPCISVIIHSLHWILANCARQLLINSLVMTSSTKSNNMSVNLKGVERVEN